MTQPTFKKAQDEAIDPSNIRYGAPDIKYVEEILEGTHSGGHRIQLKNIEKFTSPWSYYVYQENGVTYAMKGRDGDREFSDASNPRNPIQSAINQAFTSYDKATIYLAPQHFTFPTNFASTGSNSGVINLGSLESQTPKSNIEIIGAGIDKTILQNATIRKNTNTWTECVGIRNLTIDAGAVAIDQTSVNSPAANDTTGWVNAVDLWFYTHESRMYNVKLQNSRGPLLRWDGQDAGIFDSCIFINGGLGTPGYTGSQNNDNASGNQAYYTDSGHTETSYRETTWRHCYFEKTKASRGTGAMLSTRTTDGTQAGRLSINGCVFYNNDSLAKWAIDITNGSSDSPGPVDAVKIFACRGYGPNMGFRVGSGTANTIARGLISNCISDDGGSIIMRKVNDGIIANCMVHNSRGVAYQATSNRTVHVMNNIARNTNTSGATDAAEMGGLYIANNQYTTISHLDVYDTGADDTKISTTLNPQTAGLTTPNGIYGNNSSLSGQIILIDNCNLFGDTFTASPASPYWYVGSPGDAATTGTSMYLKNFAEISINGGILKSAASPAGDAIRLAGTNTLVKIKGINGYNSTLGTAAIDTTGWSTGHEYINTDGGPEMIHVYGGTLSGNGVTRDGSIVSTTTPCSVYLDSGESLVVNYSSIPSLTKDRL